MDKIHEYLEIIRLADKEASPGPWIVVHGDKVGFEDYKMVRGYQRSVQFRDLIKGPDADFMSISRTSLPVLNNMVSDCLDFINKQEFAEKETKKLYENLIRRIRQG